MFVNTLVERIRDGKFISSVLMRTEEKVISLSQIQVFKLQKVLLNRMLKYVTKHVPFYKKDEQEKCRIEDFPIVDKHIISDNFDSFCSDIKDKYVFHEGYTGGSTGEPFKLYTCGNYEYEYGKRKWLEYGYHNGDVILAMDGTKISEDKLKSGVFWMPKNKKDIPFGSLALSSLYLNDDNADIYLNYIKTVKPRFIRGYPSFIYSIAVYAKEKNKIMSGFVHAIELTSESAFDYQIELIKEIFNCSVYLQYGHTESIVFAYTFDETYRYKAEPLYGYIEVMDESGRHVKIGEIGEVVVTTLHNKAFPLIRYRTGDYAEYGGRDKRYLYLNKVYGRTQDYIYNRKGDKVLLTALIFGQHCSAMTKIHKWQLEQFEFGTVIAHIIKGKDYSEYDEKELFNQFDKLGQVNTIFDYVDEIKPTPRGKSKMLVQHII